MPSRRLPLKAPRSPRVAELLIEIGFEEMPAPWLPGLAGQLRARFVEAAEREFLEAKDASVAWTPRRLVLQADLPARQADREEPVWGPALKVAKDAAGPGRPPPRASRRRTACPSRSCCERPKDAAKPAELNLLFVRKVAGRPTGEVVPGLLAGVLRALAFPKRMNWDAWLEDGRGAFPFGRPIRWLVVLFDGTLVPFGVHALESGARGPVVVESRAETRGHRFLPKGLGQERLKVSSFAELRERLRERYVILEPDERAARIAAGSRRRRRGLVRRSRPARRVARSRRVPDRDGRARCRRSSVACRPRCSRPSSSTTRSTSPFATAAAASTVSQP